jgi:hypothetical protein
MRLLVLAAAAGLLYGQPAFLTLELPWAAVGRPYYASVQTTADPRCLNGGGVTLSLVEGELPRGLMLRGGEVTGVPSEVGDYSVAIRASTPCGSADRAFQLTVSGRPILRASPGELVFEYHEGDPAPKEQPIVVSGSWPGVPYTIAKSSNSPWLEYSRATGATPERGSAFSGDAVRIRVNPETLPAGTYREILEFSAWDGAEAPRVAVLLKVR